MKRCSLFLAGLWLAAAPSLLAQTNSMPPIQTVFIMVFENYNLTAITGSASAPYINSQLIPACSYATQYYNPPGLHPSEPNYIWLEAGDNLGIVTDDDPAVNHVNNTNHLSVLLDQAGISWRAYAEDIDGTYVPLTETNGFATKHCPFLFFDDVTGTNDPTYAYGIAHIRPYTQIYGDLQSNTVARYNFITPNICDDGHDACAPAYDRLNQLDTWLSTEIPRITNSAAYQNNGAIFITWDEGDTNTDGPIGMFILSPLAKGHGYNNSIYYTHSSTLRTFQEIFHVTPFLGDAANSTDLSDLFLTNFFRMGINHDTNNTLRFDLTGAQTNLNHVLQASSNLVSWADLKTNTPGLMNFSLAGPTNSGARFFRAVER